MTVDEAFEFKVDEQYENEKGLFTVLSIKGGQMKIQWEDGETISTDIDLQRSIQMRRQMEVRYAEAEAAEKKRKSARAAGSRRFDGFLPTDFKDSAARTRWRGRDQIGGAVSRKLSRDVHTFLSWAVAQRPEVHWQDTAHRKRLGTGEGAVFFVALDVQTLSYGFKVSRPVADTDTAMDWHRFRAWWGDPDHAKQVHAVATENDMSVVLHGHSVTHTLKAVDDAWQRADASQIPLQQPAALMDTPSQQDDALTAVVIQLSMAKDAALDRGADIAADIATLLNRLGSLYRAAVG